MAFNISNRILVDYMSSLNVNVPLGTARLVGIRGAVPFNKTQLSLRENKLDFWNDTIGIWGSEWAIYTGTVEPGLGPTKNPDPGIIGAAHLIGLEEPQGDVWTFKWGLHKQKYEALVEAENFKVRRDVDKDGVAELNEPIKEGKFGIHIHWGGQGWSVGNWSAGCQVLFGGGGSESPWDEFHTTLKETKQVRFDYYLIDGHKLAKFLGLI